MNVKVQSEKLDAVAVEGTDFEALIRWSQGPVTMSISDGEDMINFEMNNKEQRRALAEFCAAIAGVLAREVEEEE